MKKVLYATLTIVATYALFISCAKEINNPEPEIDNKENVSPQEEASEETVRINFGTDTKATMVDNLGLTWTDGDKVYWTGAGGGNGTEVTLSTPVDNYHAVADVSASAVRGTSGVFRFHPHGSNTNEFEFTLHHGALEGETLTISQESAGAINPEIIMLHSGTTNMAIAADATSLDVNMEIAGAILRFLPYTTSYGSEEITSLEFSSNSYLSGTVAYNYGEGSYRGVNDINWRKIKNYTVNLTNHFALSGINSKEASKGIYIALPKNTINGYAIKISTNVADYYFESEKELTLEDNEVKNFYLNLNNAKVFRMPVSCAQCKWQGIAQNTEFAPSAITHHAYTAEGNVLGFHEAWIKEIGEDNFVTKPAPPAIWAEFYSPVTFTVTDATTNDPVSWCSFAFRTNDSWIIPTVEENTSSESRKAKVVASFPKVVNYNDKDYYLIKDSQTLTFYLTQPGKPAAVFNVPTTSYSVGYNATSVNIPVVAESASWTASTSSPGVTLTGDTSGSGNGTIIANFEANTGAAKSYTVHVETTAGVVPNSYDVTINHMGGPDPSAEWLVSYEFDYKRVSDGMDAYMSRVENTITFNVPIANTPNPFYITFSHSSNVYSPCVGVEVPDEEGHAGHRAAPYVDGADWTAPVWCASVGTHTINFTAIGENGAVKTITLVVIVS